jgi:hypothetical protein
MSLTVLLLLLLLLCVCFVCLQMHLPGAIRRGRATRCSHCSQKGATLKCVERSCAQHFHLACARVAGCTLIVSVLALAYTVASNLLNVALGQSQEPWCASHCTFPMLSSASVVSLPCSMNDACLCTLYSLSSRSLPACLFFVPTA